MTVGVSRAIWCVRVCVWEAGVGGFGVVWACRGTPMPGRWGLRVLGKCAIIYRPGGLRGTINFHFWESHSTLLDFRS